MATGGVDTERAAIDILQVVTENVQAANYHREFRSTEIEAIVLAEISKLHVKGNRADSESVAASTQKKHGLARYNHFPDQISDCMRKLVLDYHGGKESRRLPKDPVAESRTLDECKYSSQEYDVSSEESYTNEEPDEWGNLESFGFGFDPRWPHHSESHSSTAPHEIIRLF